MTRVLVCGGRDFRDKATGYGVLDRQHAEQPISCIIEGGANGADYIAMRWAEDRGVLCKEFCADWNKHGRAAGPIRNQEMLNVGLPDVVIAFKGGRGTADMVRRARSAGVRVVEIAPDAPGGGG